MLTHGRQVLHSYLHVLLWLDNGHVELQIFGSTSGRFVHDNTDGHLYPAECFDLRYRLGLDGSLQTISRSVFDPDSALAHDSSGWHDRQQVYAEAPRAPSQTSPRP